MLLGVSRSGKSHACSKAVGGVKARGAVRYVERRPREQATADQDDKADAELQAEQHAPSELVARTTRYRRATFMKRLVLRDTQRLTHRVDAAGQRDRHGDSGDKEQNTRVAVQVEGQWHADSWVEVRRAHVPCRCWPPILPAHRREQVSQSLQVPAPRYVLVLRPMRSGWRLRDGGAPHAGPGAKQC